MSLTRSASALKHLWSVFDLAGKRRDLGAIERQASESTFWDNARQSQQLMQRASLLRAELEQWDSVSGRINDAADLAALGDVGIKDDIEAELTEIRPLVEQLEFTTRLSGEYDHEDSILAIHAGTGGVDAMDWAQMLERMYLRWCELHKFKTEILDRSLGEAGVKSVTLAISGKWSYGFLRSERGVHRLVRLSPFDSAHRRHTSFALVEVWPDVHGDVEIDINASDIVIETYRSSGAGGQNVQKNETAVRITHKLSGLVVTCQNERSLTQNRESALRVLRARLLELEQARQDAERAELKGDHIDANFGNQIRSYVLHPYQMVKDHRTNFETPHTVAVLDGQLDPLMEAYLQAQT